MSKINEVLQRFRKEHPDFIGGKIIYIIARYKFHMIHCQNPLIKENAKYIQHMVPILHKCASSGWMWSQSSLNELVTFLK